MVTQAGITDRGRSYNPRRRRSRGYLSELGVGTINLTPMIDIVFNLLIYFLVVGIVHLAEGALPAHLPATHGEAAGPVPLPPIEVYLDPDPDGAGCRISVAGVRPQRLVLAGMLDLYAQMAYLGADPDFGTEAVVVLLPAMDVTAGCIADAYNAAYQAGFQQIVFGEVAQK